MLSLLQVMVLAAGLSACAENSLILDPDLRFVNSMRMDRSG